MRFQISIVLLILCGDCDQAISQVVQNVAVNQVRIGGPMGFATDESSLEASMKMEVDAIQRVTGISDGAAKKLEVAATAAVKGAFKKAPKQNMAFNPFGQPPEIQRDDTLSDEDSEQKAKKTGEGGVQANPQLPAFLFVNTDMVKKEEIWTKTLANVLSPEQATQFQTFLGARKKRDREFAVQNVVYQMDSYLLLTDAQRTALTELVDRVQGEQLANQRIQQAGAMGGMGAVVVMVNGEPPKDLNADALKQILSPTQMVEHKRQRNLMAQGPMAALGIEPPKKAEKSAQDGFNTAWGFNVINNTDGLKIQSIEAGSAAEKAGLRVGDLIDSIAETPVDTLVQLKRALAKTKKALQVQVRREGNLIQLDLAQ